MAVYMILAVEVTDPDLFADYAKQAPATVKQYGGRYLVRGGAVAPITGEWDPERVVVIEFPSMERFREWLTSPEYSAIIPLREQSTKGKGIVVEGYDEAT